MMMMTILDFDHQTTNLANPHARRMKWAANYVAFLIFIVTAGYLTSDTQSLHPKP
jgi:hypothetical protein